jgi:hypothetical protein
MPREGLHIAGKVNIALNVTSVALKFGECAENILRTSSIKLVETNLKYSHMVHL